jgi:hypothetical protein
MKYPIFLFLFLWGGCVAAIAQVELASSSYFPADLEFRELQKVLAEESFEDPSRLSKVEDGRLILEVGFEKYSRRLYSTVNSGELSIDIVTLKDFRAAYSLLSLLRNSAIQDGPPGDAYAIAPGIIRFYQGRFWVRIHGQSVSQDLLKRIALSVSNRIGPRQQKPPSIISHFPEDGCDASTLRYFPGLSSFESFSDPETVKFLHLDADAEIAEARYTVDGQAAILFLLSFPTPQVAEEYFDTLGNRESTDEDGRKTYVKRSGPLVAILRGSINAASADKLLGAIRYSYSIRWIYEKRNKPSIIWGVPVSILGTVVRSLFFIAILAVVSILAGIIFALLRFFLRNRFSKNDPDKPESTEIIRLRLP